MAGASTGLFQVPKLQLAVKSQYFQAPPDLGFVCHECMSRWRQAAPLWHTPQCQPPAFFQHRVLGQGVCVQSKNCSREGHGAVTLISDYLLQISVLDPISRLYSRGGENRHHFPSCTTAWLGTDSEWAKMLLQLWTPFLATAVDHVSKR